MMNLEKTKRKVFDYLISLAYKISEKNFHILITVWVKREQERKRSFFWLKTARQKRLTSNFVPSYLKFTITVSLTKIKVSIVSLARLFFLLNLILQFLSQVTPNLNIYCFYICRLSATKIISKRIWICKWKDIICTCHDFFFEHKIFIWPYIQHLIRQYTYCDNKDFFLFLFSFSN